MLEGEIQVCRIPHRLLKGQKFRCSGDLETKNRIKHDLLGISCLTASRYDSLKKGEMFIVDKTGVVIICKYIPHDDKQYDKIHPCAPQLL